MKSNNYLVTHTEVKTMGFTLKGGAPADSNEIATKGWVDTYFNVNTGASPYNSYPSNRCPRYQDLVAPPSTLNCFTYGTSLQYYASCNPMYNDEWLILTATLKDQYGNVINNNTGNTITITFSYDYEDVQDYGGSIGSAYADVLIYNGQSSGNFTFYQKQYQYCNFSSACDGSCFITQYNIQYYSNSAGLGSC